MRTASSLITRSNLPLAALVVLITAGCGDGGGSPAAAPQQAGVTSVTFVYQAPTALDPQVAANFPNCVAEVRDTHIHPSWEGYAHIPMTVEGDHWTITFSDVPVGVRDLVQVNDPNLCSAQNPDGVVTANVFANSVLLTQVVEMTGAEPALAFTATANGTVTP